MPRRFAPPAPVRPLARTFYLLGDERVYASHVPEMYNRVMNRLGIRGHCIPLGLPEESLGVTLAAALDQGFAGAVVTARCQEAIVSHLDCLSEGARFIGAVNTIVCRDRHLKGYNTNAIGFMDSLREGDIDVVGRKALVIGTGGASRAVIFVLRWLSARHVAVVGQREDRLAELHTLFSVEPVMLSRLSVWPSDAEIIINATPPLASSEGEASGLRQAIGRLRLPFLEVVIDLNVPPASRIKIKARSNCDTGIFEYLGGKSKRVISVVGHIHIDVERPIRRREFRQSGILQTCNHQVAISRIDSAVPVQFGRAVHRIKRKFLSRVRGADKHVLRQTLDPADMILRHDHPAHTPARHREAFGKRVHNIDVVDDLQSRDRRLVIIDPMVNLVRDKRRTLALAGIGQSLESREIKHRLRRIGR